MLTIPSTPPWTSNPSTPLTTGGGGVVLLHNVLEDKPHLLPSNTFTSTIRSFISFCLDNNSSFEFHSNFYSQNNGGAMGSPVTTCSRTCRVKSSRCREHFPRHLQRHSQHLQTLYIENGIGDFLDKPHAFRFLKFLNH